MALWWLLLASRAQIRVLSIARLQAMHPRAIPSRRYSPRFLPIPPPQSSSVFSFSTSFLLFPLGHCLRPSEVPSLAARLESATAAELRTPSLGGGEGGEGGGVGCGRLSLLGPGKHSSVDQLRADGQNALAQNTVVHEHVGVCERDTFGRLR